MFPMPDKEIDAVVFDLGNVLIPWDPRKLYMKLFDGDKSAVNQFLSTVCTPEWNDTLDSDQTFAQGTTELIGKFPGQEALIRAYDERWEEMIGQPIPENIELLKELSRNSWPLYALSNWSAEKFPIAKAKFGFLDLFRDLVISGEVGFRKPNPAIFNLLLETNSLNPSKTVFIDDTRIHIEAAKSLGLITIHYISPLQLRAEMVRLGILQIE